MTRPDPVLVLRTQIASQLGRIFECSRILDLARSDAEFTAVGANSRDGRQPHEVGRISYVVDTNFMQAFLQPQAWNRCARLFHDPRLWPSMQGGHPTCDVSEDVASSVTLLATEMVLEHALSSDRGKIFMSIPHQKELAKQISFLRSDIRQISPDELLQAKIRNAEDIKRIAAYRELPRPEIENIILNDFRFADNQIDVSSLSETRFREIADNYIVSSICSVLARDEVFETAEQVSRLASDELWLRFATLEREFPRPDDDELRSIKASSQQWLVALKAEKKKSPQSERSEASLKADADTLAHLEWLNRHASTVNDRIVFVTGDSLILNAFRRWYEKRGDNTSFFIRPLAQYGPHYNLGRQDALVDKKLGAVERTRQALESATYSLIFPMVMHYYGNREGRLPRFAGARARDRFSVEASHKEVDEDLLELLVPLSNSEAALRRKMFELDSVAEALRWLERLSIGAFPSLVRKRVDVAIERAFEFFDTLKRARSSLDLAEAVAESVDERFAAATAQGFRFSLPLAMDLIDELHSSIEEAEAGSPRPGIGLRISFPFKGEALSARDWLTRLSSDPSKGTIFTEMERADLVFVLASWLAFRNRMWSDAVRFAEFASRAVGQEQEGSDTSLAQVRSECLYLTAFSCRMRMASDAPSAMVDADQWRRSLNRAEMALHSCVADHTDRGEPLRELRAILERAAVRLTYCAWAAVGELGSLPTYAHQRLDLRDIFRGAVEDLSVAAAKLPGVRLRVNELEGSGFAATTSRETLDWVEIQALLAPECGLIVYDLLVASVDPVREEGFLPIMPRLRETLVAFPRPSIGFTTPSPILQAYNLSARLRRGDHAARAELESLLPASAKLELDRAMLAAIRVNAGLAES